MKENQLNIKGWDGCEPQFKIHKNVTVFSMPGMFIIIKQLMTLWMILSWTVLSSGGNDIGCREMSLNLTLRLLQGLSINFDRSCDYREDFTQTNTHDMSGAHNL